MFFGISFLVFTVVNGLLFLFGAINDLKIYARNKFFRRLFNKGNAVGEGLEKIIFEGTTKAQRIGRFIVVVFSIIVYLLITTANYTIPIAVAIFAGVQEAIVTFILITLFGSVLIIIFFKSRPNAVTNVKGDILQGNKIVFCFQLIMLILFGLTPQLEIMVQTIYISNFFLKYTFSFFMPTLVFCSFSFSMYFYWMAFLNKLNENLGKTFPLKLTTLLLIFVLSSFAGLIYLNEGNFPVIDFSEGSEFARIYDIYVVLLSSFLIPLLFIFLQQLKRQEHYVKYAHIARPKETSRRIIREKRKCTRSANFRKGII